MPDDGQPTSHSIEIRGLNLHYLDWGNEGATPLLLLHGLSGTAADWLRIAEHFRETYHVIALDQRGHGESDHAPDHAYATDDFVADHEAFVAAIELDRFILCGHSMGGHNTMAYTARHPEQVICALANDIPPSIERDPARTSDVAEGVQPVFTSKEAWIENRREGSPFTPELHHRLMADARLKQVGGGYQPKSDANAQHYWAPTDLWDEVATIERPIFFVRGGQSRVLDAETVKKMIFTIEPARSIGLEQSGHSTYMDMEEEFLSASSQFFAGHTAPVASPADSSGE